MKKIITSLCMVAVLSSCFKDDTVAVDVTNIVDFDYQDIQGAVENGKTLILTGESNLLTGTLTVKKGGKLIIRPTTLIKATAGLNSKIIVEEGGALDVQGIQSAPIVMTSSAKIPMPGDWSGIEIHGDNSTDQLITVKHLRVEYAGKSTDTKENYAISLYDVENKASVSAVSTFKSTNGLLVDGGNVNLNFLTNDLYQHNAFKLTNGYEANGQFWTAFQDENTSDGTALTITGKNTKPFLVNVTLVDRQSSDANLSITNNASPKLYNFILKGQGSSVLEVDASTKKAIEQGTIILKNGVFSGAKSMTNIPLSVNLTAGSYENTYEDISLSGYTGIVGFTGFKASEINDFFIDSLYKGAVNPENDWTAWVRKK